MDEGLRATLTQHPAFVQNRRLTLGAALATTISLGLGSAVDDAAAKKKRKKKGKKKKPKTTADAACPFVSGSALTGNQRFAQTFLALRNGKLTRAEFGLRINSDGANFVVDIREVDGANEPDTVIATSSVANVPATAVDDPPRIIPVAFANPATVVSGLRYAISVTGEEGQGFAIHSNASGCADQVLFADAQAEGDFEPTISFGLVFATFVSA